MTYNAAYAITPSTGQGKGVMVLHSWFGLTADIRNICDRLAEAGFVAVAPDLFEGETAQDDEQGLALLAEADPNHLALAVQSTAQVIETMPATAAGSSIGIIGFGPGASLAMWLSERKPVQVDKVIAFYGTQGMDFTESQSDYQIHVADRDNWIDADELALMEASLHLARRPIEVHHYPGTEHSFMERSSFRFEETAAELAWTRVIEFLNTSA